MPYTSRQKATKPTSRKNDDTCSANKYIPNANSVQEVNEHWPPENGVCILGSLPQRARGMEWGGGILKEVTARYYNPVSLRPDPENFGSHRSLQNELYEEKWAQTTTE